MPSKTITTTSANFTRIVDAIRRSYPDWSGTDSQIYLLWPRYEHINLVRRDEQRQAVDAVESDSSIVEITDEQAV
jgi:hypothetical protein